MARNRKSKKAQQKSEEEKKSGVAPAGASKKVSSALGQAQLSPMALQYAKALGNPFDSIQGAYVPLAPVLPSKKLTVWNKGSLITGTQGVGFLGFSPYGGVVNDSTSVSYTLANYAGTTFNPGAAIGAYGSNTNSPYLSSAFGNADELADFRLVSAGIRVRYTGTELNRGGSIVGLSQPEGASLSGAGTARSAFLAYNGVQSVPVGTGWVSVVWSPTTYYDYDFTYQTPGVVAECPMGILITSPVLTGVSFDFEVVAHYEIMGQNIPDKTSSKGDVVGASAVADFVTQSWASLSSAHLHATRLASVISGATQTLDGYSGFVGRAAAAVGAAGVAASGVLANRRMQQVIGNLRTEL